MYISLSSHSHLWGLAVGWGSINARSTLVFVTDSGSLPARLCTTPEE